MQLDFYHSCSPHSLCLLKKHSKELKSINQAAMIRENCERSKWRQRRLICPGRIPGPCVVQTWCRLKGVLHSDQCHFMLSIHIINPLSTPPWIKTNENNPCNSCSRQQSTRCKCKSALPLINSSVYPPM